MLGKYQQLFHLDVNHSYFQKGICPCLKFKTEIETEQLMNRFRLLLRTQVNGFSLYVDGSQSVEQLFGDIEQVTGQNSFCFEISSDNPHFTVFTALPPNCSGQLIYDSSNSLVIDHKVHLNQQLSDKDVTSSIGKVTLRFADILKFSDQTGFANFDIQYQARAIQWQYFVINKSAVPLNALRIAGKEPINFEGPEHVVTADGEAALLFSSGSTLIPLSELQTPKFDLVNHPVTTDNKRLRPQIIIKGLPTPNMECIGEGMYIYL